MKDIVYAIKTMDTSLFEEAKERLLELIPSGQSPWMEKFSKPEDRQRSLLGECLSRWALSKATGIPPDKLVIRRTEKGKPFLETGSLPCFNVSHSGEWVVVALSEKEVGIDVEQVRTPEYRVAHRYFSQEEVQILNGLKTHEKTSYFFDLWTLKESYLKFLGKGLTQSLGSFTVSREKGLYRLREKGVPDPKIYFFTPLLDPGYKLAVCCQSPEFDSRIHIVTTKDLLKNKSK